MNIDFDTAQIQVRRVCYRCHGSGEQPFAMIACRVCGGEGMETVWLKLDDVLDAWIKREVTVSNALLRDDAAEWEEVNDDVE